MAPSLELGQVRPEATSVKHRQMVRLSSGDLLRVEVDSREVAQARSLSEPRPALDRWDFDR